MTDLHVVWQLVIAVVAAIWLSSLLAFAWWIWHAEDAPPDQDF